MPYRHVVEEDPLDRLFQGAKAKLGLERKEGVGQDPSQAPPPTYRPLAGLRQNMRGNSIIVNPGSSEPNVLMSRSPGDDAELVTITLGLELEGADPGATVNGAQAVNVTANIEWGIGNAAFSADCDWRWGTTLVLPANFVRIGATYQYSPALGKSQRVARLSAATAYGATSRNSNTARLTQQVTSLVGTSKGLVAGVTSDPMRIPNFATSVALLACSGNPILGTSVPAVPMMIQQSGTTDTNNVAAAHEWASGSNLGWLSEAAIPIVAGARYIFVTNNSPVNIGEPGTGLGQIFLLYGLSL